ncbi:hypothetical protein BJ878DRAFT_538717 [Calycina marina]|uniref:Uncharacterized protein n=1 Tax=Calycina marina TaxID=1763456 RepID=A0A9P8CJZ1_9HELO|nr:hypothetical protein BJ878DRAFT_538717 [Calycina marina]
MAGSIRNAISTIYSTVYATVLTNPMSATILAKVLSAVVAAGLSSGSVATYLGGFTTRNFTNFWSPNVDEKMTGDVTSMLQRGYKFKKGQTNEREFDTDV